MNITTVNYHSGFARQLRAERRHRLAVFNLYFLAAAIAAAFLAHGIRDLVDVAVRAIAVGR